MDFLKQEKKILKFWKENEIFKESISQRKNAPNFVFFEGPPTANAPAGIHHLLARVFKDVICRYKTMSGFKVLRKAGWDTHGLPVEIQIEKKLGLKSKKDIEKYGIAKFNKQCRHSVWLYKQDWEKLTERMGYWLDMKNPYITYENNYIESVWWVLKQIWDKGLFYQGYRVSPYCPRCGTTLSSHEVAQGYKKVKEKSIYVKFSVKGQKDTYFLVWTTTPWTLPGNVAIAINPNFIYTKVKVDKEYFILAKDRMEYCGIDGKIIEEIKGKDLLNLKYEAMYSDESENKKVENIYKIISGDFVSLDEGSGLVHIAPAFGEDDMRVAKENNLLVLVTVDENGKMIAPNKQWDKMFVKKADSYIVEDLRSRGIFYKEEMYEHDYPFCWRCKTPLLYYAKMSWFIQTTKVKEKLIKNNQKINWHPSHLKDGRFGEWLRELKDWAVSRERFWGTPLPVWKCEKCENYEVIGGKKDLLKQKFTTNKYFILRHGHSCRQMKQIIVCWPEKIKCLLTKKGETQIKKAAIELAKKKIDIIYCSDLLRTKQTAEIVAKKLGISIKTDPRLREINLGIYNGLPSSEFFKDFPRGRIELFHKRPPKGETWTDCKERVFNFMKEIDKKHKNKTVLIVSHGDPLWLLEGMMKGLSTGELLEEKNKQAYVKPGEWRSIDFRNFSYNEKAEIDFHRPFVDDVRFKCVKCGGTMKRVLDVMDCWFDSGSMPFAQQHYPFENKKLIDKKEQFPADYIAEAVDQTRGWFYTLLAISTLLGFKSPYKNVVSVGHVLDQKGEKMSKSKGNIVDPWLMLEKYGADANRWFFYTVNQPGDSKMFDEKSVGQALRKNIMTLLNVYTFFETYTSKKGVSSFLTSDKVKSKNVLDRWIISKLNRLIMGMTKKLNEYDIVLAARDLEAFIINDLSLWYIRRSRKRFQKPETEEEFNEASNILGFVLLNLSKVSAPFIPFLSEEIYQGIMSDSKIKNKIASVHLEDWPKSDKKLINDKLEEKMVIVRDIVAQGLAYRAKAMIKVRQPLQSAKIKDNSLLKLKTDKGLINLIKDELNVKEIIFDSNTKILVELDTKITQSLKEEGVAREVLRYIQDMRKKAGYKPRHKISVAYSGSDEIQNILERNADFILKETRAQDFLVGNASRKVFDIEKEIEINTQKLWLGIKKI